MANAVYELSYALEGLVDVHRDPLPPITHVTFQRDYLTADDMIVMVEVVGDMSDIETSTVKQAKLARALLPRMTDLSDEASGMIKASDFVNLVGIMAPFLVF